MKDRANAALKAKKQFRDALSASRVLKGDLSETADLSKKEDEKLNNFIKNAKQAIEKAKDTDNPQSLLTLLKKLEEPEVARKVVVERGTYMCWHAFTRTSILQADSF